MMILGTTTSIKAEESTNSEDSTLRRESPRLKLQKASYSDPLQIVDQSSEQQPNRIDSTVRRESGRLKIMKSQKATYSNPLVLDEGSAEQPNKRDTRYVHFDDDDFVTPPIKKKEKRNALILITDPSTVAKEATKEATSKTKRRLNVEEIGQEEIAKNEGKKLKIVHQKTKF